MKKGFHVVSAVIVFRTTVATVTAVAERRIVVDDVVVGDPAKPEAPFVSPSSSPAEQKMKDDRGILRRVCKGL